MKEDRPWGWYEVIEQGDRYKVKSVEIQPKQKLSLHLHHHRAEHWIVVGGTLKVEVDGKETLVFDNQSTYIPANSIHKLSNPGMIPLKMIEVQSGSYLGEDDNNIMRTEHDN